MVQAAHREYRSLTVADFSKAAKYSWGLISLIQTFPTDG